MKYFLEANPQNRGLWKIMAFAHGNIAGPINKMYIDSHTISSSFV